MPVVATVTRSGWEWRPVIAFSRLLGVHVSAIYRWIAVNRIPAKYLVRVANFYNVELRDLLELTGSDKSHKNTSNIKPRSVLRTLVEVYRGNTV